MAHCNTSTCHLRWNDGLGSQRTDQTLQLSDILQRLHICLG